MAKKKDDDSSLFSLIVGAILLITPFAAIASYFVYKTKVWDATKQYENRELTFEHNDTENKEMQFLKDEIHFLELSIQNAIEMGHGLGLSKNKDGSFSARSNAGREIREKLSEARNAIPLLTDSYEKIKGRPLTEWNKLNLDMRLCAAAKWGILAWVSSFAYFYFIPFQDFKDNPAVAAYAAASVACIILAGLSYLTNWAPADGVHPKPEEQPRNSESWGEGLQQS